MYGKLVQSNHDTNPWWYTANNIYKKINIFLNHSNKFKLHDIDCLNFSHYTQLLVKLQNFVTFVFHFLINNRQFRIT